MFVVAEQVAMDALSMGRYAIHCGGFSSDCESNCLVFRTAATAAKRSDSPAMTWTWRHQRASRG